MRRTKILATMAALVGRFRRPAAYSTGSNRPAQPALQYGFAEDICRAGCAGRLRRLRCMTYAILYVVPWLLASPTHADTPTPTPVNTPTPAGPVVLALAPATPTVVIGSAFDIVVEIDAGTQPVDSGAAY